MVAYLIIETVTLEIIYGFQKIPLLSLFEFEFVIWETAALCLALNESAHGACCGGLTLLLCHWHLSI